MRATAHIAGYYEWRDGTTQRTYYYHSGQRIAMREGGVTTWLFGDHLGSTSVTYRASDGQTVSQRYYAWGAIRPGPENALPTDSTFTGQRLDELSGLMYYGARWYDPHIGRFVSADTIVPEPGDPQALNRFSYCRNRPLSYVDPSGFDPLDAACVAAFRAAHGGADPTDQDRRDRLFSLMFLGSGEAGAWTDADWARYAEHKAGLWRGRHHWPGELAPGIERFAIHVERLASYYQPYEKSRFVDAFAFVFGGVPLRNRVSASWQMATNPGSAWKLYPPLHEGTEGWPPELVDDENPSHHYAGLFYVGYHFTAFAGYVTGFVRDGPFSEYNEPDLRCGDIAALHGHWLFDSRFSMYALGDVLRYSLSTHDSIWPNGYPY